MSVFSIYIATLATIHSLGAIYVIAGLLRQGPRVVGAQPNTTVTVVVAAKNEQQRIEPCLQSLARLSYDPAQLSVILVDDESTDDTQRIMRQYAETRDNWLVMSSAGVANGLHAKARPLAIGMRAAQSDWIFVADADSRVPENWIQAMLSHADESTGVLGGPFIAEDASTVFGLEKATMCFLMAVPFAVANHGGAPVASGPNMAVRSDLYFAGGGLENSPPSVAEDLALLKICASQGGSCRGLGEPDTTVYVQPSDTWIAVLEQQKRWIVGALVDAPWYLKALTFLIGMFAWTYSLLSFVGWVGGIDQWLVFIGLRVGFECTVCVVAARKFGVRITPINLAAMELHFWIGFLILPIWILLRPQVHWKDQPVATLRVG